VPELRKLNSEILYKRLLEFAKNSEKLVTSLSRNISNNEYGKQLIRSSGSVGSNYIEAIEGFSRKEFIHRLKICRKEARESIHWLILIQSSNKEIKITESCNNLISEGREIIRIFASSIFTAERNKEIQNR